jgi:predicted enzyme related to lactoylglutathione lyase
VIKGLTYAMLITPDVPRARRFFVEQLGLRTEDDEGDIFSQFTTRAGSLWAVGKPQEGDRPEGVALYLEVEDVDAAYRTWKERGVETVTEPHDAPFGRTFAFKTPDGLVLHAWKQAQPTA